MLRPLQAQLAAVQAEVPEPVDPAAADCLRGRYGPEVAQLRGWLREVLLVSGPGVLLQWGPLPPRRLLSARCVRWHARCARWHNVGDDQRARSSDR